MPRFRLDDINRIVGVNLLSCINKEKMENFIIEASPRLLSKIWIFATELIYNWGMYPLEGIFQVIDSYIPEIYDFININEIKNRFQKTEKIRLNEKSNSDKIEIHKFLPLGFRSDIKEDMPELIKIRDAFQEAFVSVPSGLEKAESWLYPYALKAGADSDLEALIYFASKGELLVPSHELSETWRKKICSDVESGWLHSSDKKIIEKAKKNELSIIDLAEIFRHSIMFPNFIHAYDNEEDFITTTFFRTMEWFQLNEYEPWADVFAQEISTAYQGGVDHVYSLYPLFYYCRSDLLLRKACLC